MDTNDSPIAEAAEGLEKRLQLAAALVSSAVGLTVAALVLGGHWIAALIAVTLIPFCHALVLLLEQLFAAALPQQDSSIPIPGWPARLTAWVQEAGTSMRVFYWEQPWRFNAFPSCIVPHEPGRPGVLLLHGYLCNRGFWNRWRVPLLNAGHSSMAITLAPAFVPIERHGKAIEAAFGHLVRVTGRPPVIVAHSMGGLAVRAWLVSRPQDRPSPTAVVTIGTPNQGTWLARWSRQPNGRQMRLGSDWLNALERSEAQMPARTYPWVCFFSNCDNVVFPTMCGDMAGADNRHLPGQPHIRLAWHPHVFRTVLELAR